MNITKWLIFLGFFSITIITAIITFILYVGNTGPQAYHVNNIDGQQFLYTNHGQIRYQTSMKDNSIPILFLHGFNGSMNNWNSVWESTSQCNSTLRLDIPGYGQSEWQASGFSLSAQSRNLIYFLNKLGIDKVHIVGTSMGGSLAAWFSAYYPEYVQSTTLLAPSGWPNSMTLNKVENLIYHDSKVNKLLSYAVNNKLYRHLFPKSRLIQALEVTRSYNSKWVDSLTRIRSQTNVVWSKTDLRVPIIFQEKIANKIEYSTLISANEFAGHDIPGKDPKSISDIFCQTNNNKEVES